MHVRGFVSGVLALVLVLLAVPATAGAEDGWWAFTGTVYDEGTGDPLPYAYVSLKKQVEGVDPEIYAAVTDQDGRFHIPPYFIGAGEWRFIYNVDCYVVVSRTGWDYAKSPARRWVGSMIDLGRFELERDPAVVPHQVIFGQDRFETAGLISEAMFPQGLDESPEVVTTGAVVIASGVSWPDALVAASVAGVEDAPVLLTDFYGYGGGWGYYSDYNMIAELRQLKPDRAIIVGGDDVVSADVEREVNVWVGADDVVRLAGDTRFETARAVAAYIADHVPAVSRTALVASGYSFADALSASPVAWSEQFPLYLVRRDGIDQATIDAMVADGVTDVMLLGGTAAVPASVEESLVAQFGGANVARTGGANRYETAALVADWGVSEFGFDFANPAIVSGQDFPDALSGGPYQGRTGSVLLLTKRDRLEPIVATALTDHEAEIEEVRFFGGPAAVSTAVRREVDLLLR